MAISSLKINHQHKLRPGRLKRFGSQQTSTQQGKTQNNHSHKITNEFYQKFKNNHFNKRIKRTLASQNRFAQEGSLSRKPKKKLVTKKQTMKLNKFLSLGNSASTRDYEKEQRDMLDKLLRDEDENNTTPILTANKSLESQLKGASQANLFSAPQQTLKIAAAAAGGRFRSIPTNAKVTKKRKAAAEKKARDALMYSPFKGVPGSIIQQIPSNPNKVNYPGKQFPVGREKLSPRSAAIEKGTSFAIVCEKCGKLVHGYTNFQEHEKQHSQVSRRYQNSKQQFARNREQRGLVKLSGDSNHRGNEYTINADQIIDEQRMQDMLTFENAYRKLRTREFMEAFQDFQEIIKKTKDPRAMKEIGRMYERGCYVDKNIAKAYTYYKQASEQDPQNLVSDIKIDVVKAILVYANKDQETQEACEKAFLQLQRFAYSVKREWFEASKTNLLAQVSHPSQAHHQNVRRSPRSPRRVNSLNLKPSPRTSPHKPKRSPRNGSGGKLRRSPHSSSQSNRSNGKKSPPSTHRSNGKKSPPTLAPRGLHAHQHLIASQYNTPTTNGIITEELNIPPVTDDQTIAYFYALCLLDGFGTEVAEADAIQMLRKAAAKGHPESMITLGCAFRDGIHGLEVNYKKAEKWFKQAIVYEYPIACNLLGKMYELGLGVKASTEMAGRLYSQGDFLGSPQSSVLLNELHVSQLTPAANVNDRSISFSVSSATPLPSSKLTRNSLFGSPKIR